MLLTGIHQRYAEDNLASHVDYGRSHVKSVKKTVGDIGRPHAKSYKRYAKIYKIYIINLGCLKNHYKIMKNHQKSIYFNTFFIYEKSHQNFFS